MPSDGEEAREAVCLRCGRCCYKKIIVGTTVFYTPYPCKWFDEATKLCSVYERRQQENPACLPIDDAIERGVLPADCPYVAGLDDYLPPVDTWNAELFSGAIEELAEALDLTDEQRAEFAAASGGGPGADGLESPDVVPAEGHR